MSFVRAASKAGAFILYDPNIRSPHKDEINELRALIYENISLANMVRGSNEDFKTILDISSGAEAYELIKAQGCDYLVYTRSNVCVEIHHPEGMTEIKVPSVETLSTIGAGDSFNAGLIYELFQSEGPSKNISAVKLEKMARTAISFGSHVCTHYENYISEDFAETMILDSRF